MLGELAQARLAGLQRFELAGVENGEPDAPPELDGKLEVGLAVPPLDALREGEDAGADRRAVSVSGTNIAEWAASFRIIARCSSPRRVPASTRFDFRRQDRLAGADHPNDRMVVRIGRRAEPAELAEMRPARVDMGPGDAAKRPSGSSTSKMQ